MPRHDSATVLIVDDAADVADSYAEQLSSVHDVRTAYSGTAALDAIDGTVDVVLLDRRMPDISGDEVLSHIREERLETRVAMVTAVDPDFDIIEMPFDDYVVKPVSRRELLDTIDRLLTCAQYEECLQEYYSSTVKYITLKRTKTSVELADSDSFAELKDRRRELRKRLDDIDRRFDDRDVMTVINDLERRYHAPTDA
ncbi:MAG: response regulator [Haloarculaceae archaeon]